MGLPRHDRWGLYSHGRVCVLADAAVYGNCFQWHVDADPSGLATARVPPWLVPYGAYANGTAGKPLFVSLLVYLNEAWKQEWDAETLFLEPTRGAGLLVQPRPGRAVLMHQDVLHRVSTPSLLARRPRYSLVWKLVFLPKNERHNGAETICRPEWGEPVRLRSC